MKNILLIEDEENLNRGISLKLKKEGYAVFSAACVSEGLKLFQDNTIDLVICDIGLPDGSGLDLCANIRQRSDVLFLFLTALDTEVDVITGYEMGADDYVTKPFSMSVLVSKISAMLKRTEKAVSNIVQTGKLTFYIDEKRVVKGDNAISITPTDWKLLMAFIEHPHHILSRKQLLERLWDSNTDYVDENAVAVNIRRLREKIEPDPSNPVYIKNTLKGIQGKFMVSYNDCAYIRELYQDFQIEAVTRINNLAQRYDNGSEFPEVLIANYDMEERKKSMPMQMNLFELYGEQKTVRWKGKETEEEPQDT